MGAFELGAALAITLAAAAQAVDPPNERLYGRITTAGGDVLEGYLRWDRNEASWSDFLDGQKELPWEHLAQAEELDPEYAEARRRERSIEAFGVRITWEVDDDVEPTRVTSAVRFGRLAWLVVLDERRARLGLKDGSEIELRGASSDLGRGLRSLVVHDAREGEVELGWRDLDRIDFMPAPDGALPPAEERLHGTLRTRGGLELSGPVAWDLDEVFASDVLDGESVDDRVDHEIPFGDVAAIEWESDRSARVVLRDGRDLVLRGTNDVNRDNRGVEVMDLDIGRAIVPWDEFSSLTFHAPGEGTGSAYAAFGGGGAIRGTVRTEQGEELVGTIRWDNDEQAGWELLDGRVDGIELDIEFDRIALIEKRESGVAVTLLDGRVLELEGTNDVDRANKGIFVTDDAGVTSLVRWSDFGSLELVW
jgi:hypothetical protein